jgi:integrase
LPVSPETARVLWRYMAERAEAKVNEPLFVTITGRPLDRVVLLEMLKDLGDEFRRRATVEVLDSFSAHADRDADDADLGEKVEDLRCLHARMSFVSSGQRGVGGTLPA